MLGITSAAVAALTVVASHGSNPPDSSQTRVTGATVTVVAQKEPADISTLPLSISAVQLEQIRKAGITTISDAAMLSPNTHFTEFTARALSNPRIRGIGSSPGNPGVATFVDGVSILNSHASSFDLIGVEQIEIVRGPQS